MVVSSHSWQALQEEAALALQRFDYAKAKQCVNRSLQGKSELPAFLGATSLYRQMGENELAIKMARRADKKHPGDAQVLSNLVMLLLEDGQKAKALETAQRCLALDAHQGHVWREYVSNCEVGELPDVCLRLEGLLNDTEPAFEFALALALDRSGNTKDAVQHYRRGNEIKRRSFRYSKARLEIFADALKKKYNIGNRNTTNIPPGPTDPIFVVGMPRSGTTLVEQILSMHSKVTGFGEINNLVQLIPDPLAVDSSVISEVGGRYVKSLRGQVNKLKRFTDKKLYNVFYIGLIAHALPGARIINVVRNRDDVCWSCFKTLFSDGNEWAYDINEVRHYHDLITSLMDHWLSLYPERILTVDHASLVADLEPTVRRMLTHAGLDWQKECLEFHRNNRPVRPASMSQVRQKLFQPGTGASKKYLDLLEGEIG